MKPKYLKPYSTQKKPKYPKSHSTQTNAKSTPFNPKPIDQTTKNKGKQSDRWRDQRSMEISTIGGGGNKW